MSWGKCYICGEEITALPMPISQRFQTIDEKGNRNLICTDCEVQFENRNKIALVVKKGTEKTGEAIFVPRHILTLEGHSLPEQISIYVLDSDEVSRIVRDIMELK